MDEPTEAHAARRIHPESLTGANESLFEFLSAWFGGPQRCVDKKGRPRLCRRHLPHTFDSTERDKWMLCMRTALTEQVANKVLRERLIGVFSDMADHMLNTDNRAGCCGGAFRQEHPSTQEQPKPAPGV